MTKPQSIDFKNYNIVEGFNSIAPRYDFVNDAMSFGLHRIWRNNLCRRAKKSTPRGGSILDVATGTGEVIRGLIQSRPDLKITGVDPSEGMLQIAREKFSHLPPQQASQIELKVGDARQLSFADNTFDTITISWGIRNVLPFQDGLREMLRVLKPGGTLLILESGQPENPIISFIYYFYSRLLPLIGGGLSGFKPAYEYYKHSAEHFPSGRLFLKAMEELKFRLPHYRGLFGGIVYLYTAQK